MKSYKFWLCCFFSSIVFIYPIRLMAQSSQPGCFVSSNMIANVAEMLSPSVVSIQTESDVAIEYELGAMPRESFGVKPHPKTKVLPKKSHLTANASGVIITTDGYILTNEHVVEGASKITVYDNKKTEYEAKVVGKDRFSDLAVIKIDTKNLKPAKLGNSCKIRPGDWVIALGNPLGLGNTVTFGIISAIGREVPISNIDFIQTDAAINPGNSGGPLVNIDGEVIGVNTAIVGRAQGIGFAIPINVAKEISDSLIAGKTVVRPWVGIAMSPINKDMAKKLGISYELKGIVVKAVAEGSPAYIAGVKPGDLILKVDGNVMSDPKDFQAFARSKPLNSKLSLQIYRQGKTMCKNIIISQWPEKDVFEELQ